ncbi:hypothetical protein BKA81DRAFT_303917 [Phyllosticta paracitricarpa]|uniref:Protein SIP5 n=2 Tax=Phyllosticta TaxID=121621 RepID=A0ABR1MNS7_9PEZI
MGNNSSREGRPTTAVGHSGHSRAGDASHAAASHSSHASGDRIYSSRTGRGSGPDLSFLGIRPGSSSRDAPEGYTRRETKAEREARKLAKERELREKERERSMREEGVDGGYLVTLGTYTGTEDFSKQIVRQLMIERRIAPFWKGLNDHNDSWAEHQLVAAVRGLPIPPADEVPPELESKPSAYASPKASDSNLNGLMVPITGRSQSATSDTSGRLSPGYGGFSLPSPSSPAGKTTSSNPFIRTRAKTLAALSTTSKNNSQADMTPQEIMLPKDPYVNGQPVEAFLYKDASECPICFLYYPPYLNRTRCCDQPICSECFVQIKRPDPHPPEHHDPNDPSASQEPQDDCMLISEPAACPFCVQPEFGVTYEPPPFRRGLAYQGQLAHPSAMSSSSSLSSPGVSDGEVTRKRGKSLSANSPGVITTDMIRPDWAKKLNDARAHALRRSAAATALHNAAYVIGNNPSESRGFGLGRRRRTLFSGDSPNSSGQGTPRNGSGDPLTQLLSNSSRSGDNHENPPGRHSSRRTRMEDLEELMMMEAIRLSLAAEEERKKKEEKEAAKQAKKEEKKKAKEEKKMTKNSRKSGFFPVDVPEDESSQAGPSSQNDLKGKAIDRSGAGFNPLSEPTSTVGSSSARSDPQRHLEESRARIHSSQSSNAPDVATPPSPQDSQTTPSHRAMLRQLSNASSSESSFAESESERDSVRNNGAPGIASGSSFEPSPNTSGLSLGTGNNSPGDPAFAAETPPGGGAGTEPMFNFRSLAAVIGNEEERAKSEGNRRNENTEHIEDVGSPSTPDEEPSASLDESPKQLPTVHDVAEASGTHDNISEKASDSTGSLESAQAEQDPVTPVSAEPPIITTTPASPPDKTSMAAKANAREANVGLPQKGYSDVRVDEHAQE